MSKIIEKEQKIKVSPPGIELMAYLLKSKTFNHWTNIFGDPMNI
jgi:hypothetical protein